MHVWVGADREGAHGGRVGWRRYHRIRLCLPVRVPEMAPIYCRPAAAPAPSWKVAMTSS